MIRYLITCEETCPNCNGRSVPYDPENNRRSSCAKCLGSGVIRKEVELSEAIKEMNIGKTPFDFELFSKFKMYEAMYGKKITHKEQDYAYTMRPVPPPDPIEKHPYGYSPEAIKLAKKSWLYRILSGIPKHLLDR